MPTKPYKTHLLERLQTTEDRVGYLRAAFTEDEATFERAVKDVCESVNFAAATSPEPKGIELRTCDDGHTAAEKSLVRELKSASVAPTSDHKARALGLMQLSANLAQGAIRQTEQMRKVGKPTDMDLLCQVLNEFDALLLSELETHLLPEIAAALASTVPAECMMADCTDPQEHFCFKHSAGVFGVVPLSVFNAHTKEWQQMETAPRDGTEILLWWPYWRKNPVIGHYSEHKGNGFWDTEAKLIEYGQGAPDHDEDPKGWQPLPAPPLTEEN